MDKPNRSEYDFDALKAVLGDLHYEIAFIERLLLTKRIGELANDYFRINKELIREDLRRLKNNDNDNNIELLKRYFFAGAFFLLRN